MKFWSKEYILLGMFLCFSVQVSAADTPPKLKKNQTDTCFPALLEKSAALNKQIKRINNKHNDNFLYVVPVWNYRFTTSSRQEKTLSSFLSLSENAICSARNKTVDYCPNIADVFTMKGVALLYKKEYSQAYRVFDTVVAHYQYARSWMSACLWRVHALLFMEDYATAELLLSEIDQSSSLVEFNDVIHYEIIQADLLIKTFRYEEALSHLLNLERIDLDAKIKVRVKFGIAQIYDNIGEHEMALLYYNDLMRRSIPGKLMSSYVVTYRHFAQQLLLQQQLLAVAPVEETEAESEEFEPTIVESSHDSTFFDADYPYYFNDLAAMFFLDESQNAADDNKDTSDYGEEQHKLYITTEMLETVFENWDSLSIHISKTDFSNMTDTIYLPLLEEGKAYALPSFNPVVSRFGWRRYRYHYGIDFKQSVGDSIYCVFDGIVRIARRNRTYGNIIIVRHYNGLETFYAHCSKLLAEPNQEVKTGDIIALAGNTGRSTGPHLHFETRYKGMAFNPEYIIDFENGKLISDTLMITKEIFNYRRSSSSASASASSSVGSEYYSVRLGDTLSVIAKKHRTTVASLKRLNGLKYDFIREGQRLRIR
ncbi:MAG: peptidoglycan DD-metalloendopeptidase family protein [Bacteroidales bacterium]|nr:peptidoglycan DD-metalloendopeptidase family protein [Bacteroidales bacterium]